MSFEFPPLIDPALLERADRLSAAQLCDGMKELGLPNGCMCAEIGAVDPSMRMVGTAATVKTDQGDNFPIHVATYSSPGDGYVMVIDGNAYHERCYLGDLIMGAAKAAGYLGIVLDGYTRDRAGNVAMGFPVFSRGLLPASPIKKDHGTINAAITCGGVPVEPGDLVVGDYDGVCVVPRGVIEAVLESAEKKRDYEEKREESIRRYAEAKAQGQPLPQLAPQWVLDLLNK